MESESSYLVQIWQYQWQPATCWEKKRCDAALSEQDFEVDKELNEQWEETPEAQITCQPEL